MRQITKQWCDYFARDNAQMSENKFHDLVSGMRVNRSIKRKLRKYHRKIRKEKR